MQKRRAGERASAGRPRSWVDLVVTLAVLCIGAFSSGPVASFATLAVGSGDSDPQSQLLGKLRADVCNVSIVGEGAAEDGEDGDSNCDPQALAGLKSPESTAVRSVWITRLAGTQTVGPLLARGPPSA
jgi:hypothetical protein